MIRVDYIDGHDEFDDALWYEDGLYVGTATQWRVELLVPDGESRLIDLHHRVIRPDLDFDDIEPFILGKVPLEVLEEILVPEAV